MQKKDIFQRDLAGEQIFLSDPEYHKIRGVIDEAQRIIARLNASYHDPQEVRRLFSELTGKEVDATFRLLPPFYTDFGKNISVGKNVFINHGCEFMDRGGITLGDDVLIAPRVNLITIDHPLNPDQRQSTISRPIVIERNAWICVGATVMPGVTVGENAVVSAGAIVTKDVAPNTVVAGIPAKTVKKLDKI